MTNKKRVVVTGFGTINPLGNSAEEYWENSLKGKSGTVKNERFSIPDDMSQVNGLINNIDSQSSMFSDFEKTLDKSIQYAIIACNEALERAGISEKDLSCEKINVSIATAIGNINKMESTLMNWSNNEDGDILYDSSSSQNLSKQFQFNCLAGFLSGKYKLSGESVVIATGCTGGVDAVGYAFDAIRNGEADIVISGSSEAPITPLVVAAFSQINATTSKFNNIPEKASRPFDSQRDGFVLSEGCGIIILEELEHAQNRNAPIYAEVLGFGSCNNSLHMTDIPNDGNAIARSINLALRDANIESDKIDFVNLHGSSTPQNDIAEQNALYSVMNSRYDKVPVTSNKSQIGHSLSASNSIEIVSCLKTLETGIIPPTINIEELDQDCKLNVIQSSEKMASINYILKNSSGFSGIHSSLILKKFNERG